MREQLEFDELVEDRSTYEDAESSTAVRYTISSYGADYPVDMLVSRLNRGDIEIPVFQRGFVWSHPQASRFVESLLLGLPVPGIFLSRNPSSNKLLVIDGQQRLKTLQYFYSGFIEGKEFALRGVNEELEGITFDDLPDEDRRRLDDSIIHATIVRQDDPEGDQSSIYLIFERLNTGGTPLSPQEIRASLYHGRFSKLLEEMNNYDAWRNIYGPISRRAKDQELILRFLALHFALEKYQRPMKLFLSRFMERHRRLEEEEGEEFRRIFKETTDIAYQSLPEVVFRPERNLNASYLDAVLVALAGRLEQGPIENHDRLADECVGVTRDSDFIATTRSGTTDPSNVRKRIGMMIEAMSRVE